MANVDKVIKIVREILKFIDSTAVSSTSASITSNSSVSSFCIFFQISIICENIQISFSVQDFRQIKQQIETHRYQLLVVINDHHLEMDHPHQQLKLLIVFVKYDYYYIHHMRVD